MAATEVIRSIVSNLPTWTPLTSATLINDFDSGRKGFLSLSELRLDRVLAQGARLYSMDARDLDIDKNRRLNKSNKVNLELAPESTFLGKFYL